MSVSIAELADLPPEQRVPTVLASDDANLMELLTSGTGNKKYVEPHLARFRATLAAVPAATSAGLRLLVVGAWTPEIRLLHQVWGYDVAACGMAPRSQRVAVDALPGMPAFSYDLDAVDVETDRLPYDDATFDLITCWEVVEHLRRDPMFMMWELNRVLRSGGTLVLTTPNIVSRRAVRAILRGEQPMFAPGYKRNGSTSERHNREYAASEVRRLLTDAGFTSDGVTTLDVWDSHRPGLRGRVLWSALGRLRGDWGDNTIAVAVKTNSPRERYPTWLYDET